MAPCPNMGAEIWNFLKLLKTMIVGALWFRLGLLKSDKNDGVLAPEAGAKMHSASKNAPNLPKTLPNSNIFQKN